MTRSSVDQPHTPLEWWYWLAAPPNAPASAGFAARERVRRARLASLILLGMVVLEALLGVVRLGGPEMCARTLPGIFRLLPLAVACTIAAILLNRRVRLVPVTVLAVLVSDMPVIAFLFFAPGHVLAAFNVPALYSLVVSVLITGALLPGLTAYFVVACDSTLIFILLALRPLSPTIAAFFAQSDELVAVVVLYATVQFIAASLVYAVTRSAARGIRLADRAEEFAALERQRALLMRDETQRKRELEEGVRLILTAHVQIANGNFQTRVPHMGHALLWQVGISLNNLIARLDRVAQSEAALKRVEEDALTLVEAIHARQLGGNVPWPSAPHSPLEGVIEALRVGDILAESTPHAGGATPVAGLFTPQRGLQSAARPASPPTSPPTRSAPLSVAAVRYAGPTERVAQSAFAAPMSEQPLSVAFEGSDVHQSRGLRPAVTLKPLAPLPALDAWPMPPHNFAAGG